jgi:hypothetical protein
VIVVGPGAVEEVPGILSEQPPLSHEMIMVVLWRLLMSLFAGT